MSDSKNYLPISVYAVEGNDDEGHVLKMREIPLIGDTVIILSKGIFKVKERGQIADATKLSLGWVRLENVNDPNIAPGSDNYRFMKKFSNDEP